MPTPNTYDLENFKKILFNAGNLFHQTSLQNLSSILNQKIIYSPGTQWGLSPSITSTRYTANGIRLKHLKNIAERGFIDYVFCSFENGILNGSKTYGTVGLEFDKSIVLERESFIYPFNFISWDFSPLSEKFSDLTTWNNVITHRNFSAYNEVLIRRKVDLDHHLVKIHCFQGVRQKVVAILKSFGYSHVEVESHNDVLLKRKVMEKEQIAIVDGIEYKALLNSDGTQASLYNVVAEDDSDFMGKFFVIENDLVEFFPMSGTKKVIGHLKSALSNSQLA